MKVAVLHGERDLRVEERDVPDPGPGEVLLKVGAATTCGTDLKVYRRGYHSVMLEPPCAFGHEFAGTIEEVGLDVDPKWRAGLRVAAVNSATCDRCAWCTGGQPNLCANRIFVNGAYAEYLLLPRRLVQESLFEIGNEIPLRVASLLEPLACAHLGIVELELREGEDLLVLGGGPMGILLALLAKSKGCRVTLAGKGRFRLDLAASLLESPTIDVEREDIGEEMAVRFGHGRGPDAVVEAVGSPEAWTEAVRVVRRGGRVNFFGGCERTCSVRFSTERIHYDSLRIMSSFHHTPETTAMALESLSSGKLPLDRLITRAETLERVPQLFEELLAERKACKCVIRPSNID